MSCFSSWVLGSHPPSFFFCVDKFTRTMSNIRKNLKAPHDGDELPGARIGHGVRGQKKVFSSSRLPSQCRAPPARQAQRFNRQVVKAESTRTILRHVRDEEWLESSITKRVSPVPDVLDTGKTDSPPSIHDVQYTQQDQNCNWSNRMRWWLLIRRRKWNSSPRRLC